MKKVFEQLLEAIPNYQEFLTVDEMDESSRKLAQAYPDSVELFEIGKTSKGRAILCLKIGNGSKNGLMLGCPHPNEPIGAMMLEHFSWYLAGSKELQEELDYSWYIVKTWDADGTRLNEGWFKGPFNIRNYARNFYRPAGKNQVEWTFPISYKDLDFQSPISETKAVMDLMEQIKPSFIYSLHNAAFGGVYWYTGEGADEIYDGLYKSAEKQGIPLSLGEPEAPFCVALAPAIYKMISIKDFYDYLEKYGATDIPAILTAGDCGAEYAKDRWGTFTFLTELPYFYEERIMDLSPSDMIRKDAALDYFDYEKESNRVILDILEPVLPYIPENDLFLLAIKDFTKDETSDTSRKMVEENPDFQKLATVAEKFDSLLLRRYYKLLCFGMLIRVNENALAEMENSGEENDEKKAALEKAMAAAVTEFDARVSYLEEQISYQVIPIRKLVSIQLESGMLIADFLSKQ